MIAKPNDINAKFIGNIDATYGQPIEDITDRFVNTVENISDRLMMIRIVAYIRLARITSGESNVNEPSSDTNI